MEYASVEGSGIRARGSGIRFRSMIPAFLAISLSATIARTPSIDERDE